MSLLSQTRCCFLQIYSVPVVAHAGVQQDSRTSQCRVQQRNECISAKQEGVQENILVHLLPSTLIGPVLVRFVVCAMSQNIRGFSQCKAILFHRKVFGFEPDISRIGGWLQTQQCLDYLLSLSCIVPVTWHLQVFCPLCWLSYFICSHNKATRNRLSYKLMFQCNTAI